MSLATSTGKMRHHLLAALCFWLLPVLFLPTAAALAARTVKQQGTAAKPLDKKKIAIAGVGGYAGAVTFGFLQRAASLYGTGIGAVRGLGATADSATRLNRVLSKNFVLAFADENNIKLTDLMDPEAIAKNLRGWDALIVGTDVGLSERTVTLGTYEKTPNDRTVELYWSAPAKLRPPDNIDQVRQTLLNNLIQGAQQAGVQHVCLVDEVGDDATLQTLRESTSLTYTCLRPISAGGPSPLTVRPDYTYRTGVMQMLRVEPLSEMGNGPDSEKTSSSSSPSSSAPMLYREDLAALVVQSLLQLDWSQSRCLQVSTQGQEPSSVLLAMGPKRRPDQEWCVRSFILEEFLAAAF